MSQPLVGCPLVCEAAASLLLIPVAPVQEPLAAPATSWVLIVPIGLDCVESIVGST